MQIRKNAPNSRGIRKLALRLSAGENGRKEQDASRCHRNSMLCLPRFRVISFSCQACKQNGRYKSRSSRVLQQSITNSRNGTSPNFIAGPGIDVYAVARLICSRVRVSLHLRPSRCEMPPKGASSSGMLSKCLDLNVDTKIKGANNVIVHQWFAKRWYTLLLGLKLLKSGNRR